MSQAPVVVLIGTGAGGICGGVNLRARMGFKNFVILEKASRGFGGTWRHQRYPGISCDIPAHYYSYSFEPNAEWSSEYPPAAEIQPYLERISLKYGLDEHTSFNTEIDHARWNNTADCWDVHYNVLEPAKEGKEAGHWKGDQADKAGRRVLRSGVLKANVIMNTSGPFTQPYWPDYPGHETFKGTQMHACEWDPEVPLQGKRVAIVGSGPTAIQIVPEIAHLVGQLDVYQRTPNWIQPFNNAPIPEADKARWRKDPVALKQKRLQTMNNAESTWVAIETPGSTGALRYVRRRLGQELWPYLTPDYPIGCKRICVDPGYLPCLNRANVDLVCDPIVQITPRGIVTEGKQAGGRKEREYDIIVYATGWGQFTFGRGFPVYGRDGKEVWEQWKDIGIPRSFMGLGMVNFPNLIMSVGPQGNVWTSFIELEEQVSDYMVRMLTYMIKNDVSSFEPKLAAETGWADFCSKYIPKTPYVANCVSYYVGHGCGRWWAPEWLMPSLRRNSRGSTRTTAGSRPRPTLPVPSPTRRK
ncbi:hypothetical protein DFJ74DRAFT_602961 [Hyaloraphidium curvatum]|nr:hypothetical protein DFJ74DRAFT_602961 [Hyaloraphidium curvatum]